MTPIDAKDLYAKNVQFIKILFRDKTHNQRVLIDNVISVEM